MRITYSDVISFTAAIDKLLRMRGIPITINVQSPLEKQIVVSVIGDKSRVLITVNKVREAYYFVRGIRTFLEMLIAVSPKNDNKKILIHTLVGEADDPQPD